MEEDNKKPPKTEHNPVKEAMIGLIGGIIVMVVVFTIAYFFFI